MRILLLISLFFLSSVFSVYSQDTVQEINPDGYNIFYHDNGVKSSEGNMKNGQPEGYWKTYNEEGILISEGNRKNYQLDSTWRFYNDDGSIKLEINYLEGKKNGIRKTYREDEIIEEMFVNNIKDGTTRYYFADGDLKKEIVFEDGLEEGLAKEYGKDGRIITLITYKGGFIVEIEKINGYIAGNKKHGKWKYFYDNGQVRLEGNYKRGLEHGYFKEYDTDGNLLTTTKYDNGLKVEDAQELTKLEVRKDYYPDGKLKIVATYSKEGVPEGVRREYAEDGTIEKSYIFKNGIIIGEGIVTEKGEKDGRWKEYYPDGSLMAVGDYEKDLRTGPWKYYHKNGKLKQEGKYSKEGKPEGEWFWYYNDGNLLREDYYYMGLLDGEMVEYSKEGVIIARGEYIEGNENGSWFYLIGDSRIEGSYLEGRRDGLWKYWQLDGFGKQDVLRFEGRFIEDNPHGEHTYYWDNGNRKDEGEYVMGLKNGDWISFDYLGLPEVIITYQNGKEIKYDGIKIVSANE